MRRLQCHVSIIAHFPEDAAEYAQTRGLPVVEEIAKLFPDESQPV